MGSSWTGTAVGFNFEADRDCAFERLGTHRHHYALPIDRLTPAAFTQSLQARLAASRRGTSRRVQYPGVADRSLCAFPLAGS